MSVRTPAAHPCPACESALSAFAPGPGGRPGARCPTCQALERHRLLIMLLGRRRSLFAPPARVLDVAPAPAIGRFLTARLGAGYVATDMFMPRGISARSDLTRMCFATDSFDAIICYHVLEHVPDDAAAMAELARVLKPGGIAFVQVPWRPGATDEDPSASVEERVRRFGQDDHIRYYGDDFEERLARGGLSPTVVRPAESLSDADVARFGLIRSERIWICRRRGLPSRPSETVSVSDADRFGSIGSDELWTPPAERVPPYRAALLAGRRFANAPSRVLRRAGRRARRIGARIRSR